MKAVQERTLMSCGCDIILISCALSMETPRQYKRPTFIWIPDATSGFLELVWGYNAGSDPKQNPPRGSLFENPRSACTVGSVSWTQQGDSRSLSVQHHSMVHIFSCLNDLVPFDDLYLQALGYLLYSSALSSIALSPPSPRNKNRTG